MTADHDPTHTTPSEELDTMSTTPASDPTAPMDPAPSSDDTLALGIPADQVPPTIPSPTSGGVATPATPVAPVAPVAPAAAASSMPAAPASPPSGAVPTAAYPAPPAASVAGAPAPRPAAAVITGPAPFPIIVGLLGLAIAITAIVTRAADLTVDWGRAGPITVVGTGLVLIVLGLIGMRGRRGSS